MHPKALFHQLLDSHHIFHQWCIIDDDVNHILVTVQERVTNCNDVNFDDIDYNYSIVLH